MIQRAIASMLMPALALALMPEPAQIWAAAQGATPAATPSETDALARCRALVGALPPLPDAPTRVTDAAVVAAGPALPPFCQVTAAIAPHVGLQMRLPLSTWNHKVLEYARGGFCRPVTMGECDSALRKGYACVISDDGNQTSIPDDVWAYNDTQDKVDCGFRATHVTAVAAKALAGRFYGERPRYAYLMGCSTGGRLAMTEATRFPYDFDGIIAGAPPISKYYNGISLAWDAVAVLNKDGSPLLLPDDVRLLHKAVMADCDAQDGLKDGVISDPRACTFDPGRLQCKDGQTTACLTADKVAAVRKIYQGPVNSKGASLYNGAPARGSELTWIGAFVSDDGKPSPIFESMNDMFRNLAYPAKGQDWTIAQLDWDTVSEQVSMAEAYASGANPDLRRFKAHGGKLIAYHGLNDPFVMPGNFADYYETVERAMGGRAATMDFFRLFQPAGLNHCAGGDGAGVIDYIQALETWVEHGQAPQMLIAAHLKSPDSPTAGLLPVDPANVAFTRPVFPYPMVTRYRAGDPNAASSFVAAPSMAVAERAAP